MREIVVISGKGGTGKTSMCAALAHLASGGKLDAGKNIVICDLDVDAPDLHLLLSPAPRRRESFVSGNEAEISPEICIRCGKCAGLCKFDAVLREEDAFVIDSMRCEGCGVCFHLCPAGAIAFPERECGEWYISDTRFGVMAHALLNPGQENSGRLVSLLKQYLFVGGMPEAVLAFAETADPNAARRVHNDLLRSYNADFSKYADDALAERIRRVWRAVPANLAKENRKFMFSKIRESARAREYEDALQWLADTSLVCPSTCVSAPEPPLISHEDESVFKVYLLDVGLLGAMNNVAARTILDDEVLFSSFKGALAEQFAAQEILACGQAGNGLDAGGKLHYFVNQATRTEIDFIVDGNALAPQPVPIEVKAGVNLQAKSLSAFVRKYQPPLAVRTSLAHPSQDGIIEDVPLYALGAYFQKNIAGKL